MMSLTSGMLRDDESRKATTNIPGAPSAGTRTAWIQRTILCKGDVSAGAARGRRRRDGHDVILTRRAPPPTRWFGGRSEGAPQPNLQKRMFTPRVALGPERSILLPRKS